MPIEYGFKEFRTETGFKCDCCGKQVSADDVFEFQEMVYINFVGGYSSVWGDGTVVDITFCNSCSYDVLKDYYTPRATLGE